MSLIDTYREAGFDDREIRPLINQRRVRYAEAGFNRGELDTFFGSFNVPAAEELSELAPDVGEQDTEPVQKQQKLPIREQLKVQSALGQLPSPIAEEVRKRAIELQREKEFGAISETPFSVGQMIGNIPKNTTEIVNSVSSLIANTGIFTYKFGKNLITDVNTIFSGKLMEEEPVEGELQKQFKPATDLAKAIVTDWGLLLSGGTPKEIDKLPAGKAADMVFDILDRQGIGRTLKNFVQEHPVDAFFVTTAIYQAAGQGARLTMEGVNSFIPKGTKVADTLDSILSTKRTPIIYEMPVIDDGIEGVAKSVEFGRAYSENPLTKYIFQQSFDSVLEKYPGMNEMFGAHKAKKLLNNLRNVYEDATFKERARMHEDIFKQLNTLTKEEQAIMVPYLEGRLSLINESSEQFKGFETWYRSLIDTVQTDLMQRGALTATTIEERLYQPIMKATGLSKEQIMEEMGDFTPVYIHHFFPDKYAQKMGIHFADTTGKRFKPGFLKKSKGVSGYSESLKDILPKWTSEYIKYKNTEAFLTEFTSKFGVKVNIKDIEEIAGGLKVGDKVYEGYKIIAPDNYLSFYKRKIDFYKEVSKRMESATFDEAVGDALQGMSISVVGVSKNKAVYLVREELVKELESFATPVFGSQKAQDVIRLVVDKPTQIWKDSVLALAPRWIKNNVMGDIIFNTMEGVGPFSYSRGFQKIYQDVIPDELLKASFANVMKYNPKLGKTAETAIGGLVKELYDSKLVDGISKIKDTGYAINTMFEQPFVRALYVKLAREKAIKLIKEQKAKPVSGIKVEPLAQEAKKYKTAEEFVEGQIDTPEGLARQYGFNAEVKAENAGGEWSGFDKTVRAGTDRTPVNYRAGDWTGKDTTEFISTKKYPKNIEESAHEIAHGIFSENPEKAHVALREIQELGVPQEVAFESLVDMGGLYLLEPKAITNPKLKGVLDKWLADKVKTKSQLTDIWNKANAEVGSSSLTEENILATMAEMKSSPELVDPIIAQVKETLPVFNLTGNWERKYIRRLMPFYNWYKFMGKYAATLPIKHPFKTVAGRGLGALSEKQREDTYKDMFPFMAREIDDSGIPEVFNHLWPISNKDGKVTFFNTRGMNPFATIEDFTNLDLINMASPVVTIPYERITGRSAFGDREFRSGEKGIEYTVDGVKYTDFEKVRPPLMDHILSQFPQYDLIRQTLVPARQYDTGTILNPEPIIDEITGEPKYTIDNMEKMLNYMGIDKRTIDAIDLRTKWDNYQQRKRQALGAAFKKGQGKVSQALSFDEIRGVINEIKTDKKLWEKLSNEVSDSANIGAEETRRLRKKIQLEEGSM